MKKVFSIAVLAIAISIFASCTASRQSECPSHDPNFFRKLYYRR